MRDGANVVPYTPEIPLKLLISLEFVVLYDKDWLDVGGQCWYVLGCDSRGYPIGKANEIPLVMSASQELGGSGQSMLLEQGDEAEST